MQTNKLTREDVVKATEFMRPVDAQDVVILAFVQIDGKWLMACPLAADWMEMVSYATHCRGVLPGMKPQAEGGNGGAE